MPAAKRPSAAPTTRGKRPSTAASSKAALSSSSSSSHAPAPAPAPEANLPSRRPTHTKRPSVGASSNAAPKNKKARSSTTNVSNPSTSAEVDMPAASSAQPPWADFAAALKSLSEKFNVHNTVSPAINVANEEPEDDDDYDDEDESVDEVLPEVTNSAASNPSECINYCIDEKVEKLVLTGKRVPIFKLLQGYEYPEMKCHSSNSESYDRAYDKKLEKQVMTIDQLIFGLKKYCEIINMYPDRVADVERHITNVLCVSIQLGGKAAFFYHHHVWDRFFKGGRKVWGDNFMSICPDAKMSAATAASVKALWCEFCVTWDHLPEKCTNRLRDNGSSTSRCRVHDQQQQQQQSSASASAQKQSCVFFNHAQGCKFGTSCRSQHTCSKCSAKDHGATNCRNSGPMDYTDY